MTVPLVTEAEWLEAYSALPAWDPPLNPVLIIAPHPDDETLGAGGFILSQRLREVDVVVAAITDGENAYAETPGLADLREDEQTNALVRLQVAREKIVRFRLPDGAVASCGEELVERLTPLVSENTHVVAPWQGDFHPDHQACGRAAEHVVRRSGATLTSYFFWTWHYGTVALLNGVPLRRFPLSPELLIAKSDALSSHQSQLIRREGDPVLPELLLAPARRPFEIFSVT